MPKAVKIGEGENEMLWLITTSLQNFIKVLLQIKPANYGGPADNREEAADASHRYVTPRTEEEAQSQLLLFGEKNLSSVNISPPRQVSLHSRGWSQTLNPLASTFQEEDGRVHYHTQPNYYYDSW